MLGIFFYGTDVSYTFLSIEIIAWHSQTETFGISFVYTSFELVFPTRQDSANFLEKGTEVPLLSRDKGTTRQAQNLAKGHDRLGQPVKTRDVMGDETV